MLSDMVTDFSQLGILKRCWREFFTFYGNYVKDLNFYKGIQVNGSRVTAEVEQVRQTMQKYHGQLMEVPAIGQNLFQIIKILKDEEKYEATPLVDHNHSVTEANSECFDYFIRTRILESLVNIAIADEPKGFFKFILGVIEDLV